MSTVKTTVVFVGLAILLLSSCAVSPEVESRRQAIEADIEEILSLPLDPSEYGDTKRCLSDMEFRTFRALDDRHIVFEGRKGKLWINKLKGRCPDLRHGNVLVVRKFGGSRMCERDQFKVTDWFDWPWYRRWPWHWGSWGTGPMCTLGPFQPVTEAQIAEIEARLEDW